MRQNDDAGDSSPPEPPDMRKKGVTVRALALGVCLIPFNAFWVVRMERVLTGPYPSTISLFANVVFVLFVLVGLNGLCRRFLPRIAISQGELLTLYTMLAISTGLTGLYGVGILGQRMPHGGWFGKTNHWDFLDAFPSWLVVRDENAVRGHFLGNSTFYRASVLRASIVPMLAWTGFITLLLFVANCINMLARRQWADRGRLTFPVIWLPIEMTSEGTGTPFFRNRLMWAGFALAAGLSLWNGNAFLHPALPMLPIGITDLKPMMTAKPWSAIDWFPVTFYPLVIGLGFLLPLDLLFSCWFFFLTWKAQGVVSAGMGWDVTPRFPFVEEQCFGSILGLFLFYFWTGRRAYAEIGRSCVRHLRGRSPETSENLEEARESGNERRALFGLVAGIVALVAFGIAAGAAWWVVIAFFALYLPTITVITRIRAELGSPVHDFHFVGPDYMIPRVVSATALHPHDMAFFTFGFGLTRAHRSDTMPVGLEGLQMAKLRGMDSRGMFGAIMLATALGALSTFWAMEHQAYVLGAAAKFNQGSGQAMQGFTRMNGWFHGTLDNKTDPMGKAAIGFGFLVTVLLASMRLRSFNFPFHPIGYAVASSWQIHICWMPLFIAWVLKSLTMRFGGLRAYRNFLPFFFGLILGDSVMGSLWGLISLLYNVPTYNFFGS